MFGEMKLDDNNTVVMKLLHYFITEKDYNPIILQGADNEIWLENMNEDYKVVRIVTEHIYNDEQFTFDSFKTKRIVRKIKKKTLTLNLKSTDLNWAYSGEIEYILYGNDWKGNATCLHCPQLSILWGDESQEWTKQILDSRSLLLVRLSPLLCELPVRFLHFLDG